VKLILLLFLFTLPSLAQESFGGKKLHPDTTKVPGMTVWIDSSKNHFTRIMLAPQADGSFLTEDNVLLLPVQVQILTSERLEYVKAEINLWRAKYLLEKSDKEKK